MYVDLSQSPRRRGVFWPWEQDTNLGRPPLLLQQRQEANGAGEEQVQYRFVVSEVDVKSVHPFLSILSLQGRSIQTTSISRVLKICTLEYVSISLSPSYTSPLFNIPPIFLPSLPTTHISLPLSNAHLSSSPSAPLPPSLPPPHHFISLTFSIANMWWLKYCCSCSLARLMQNCSKLLWRNISNPKMSRMPATCGD